VPTDPAAQDLVAHDLLTLWTSSAFVAEARGWVAAQLAPRGIRITGEWELPHTRAWSSTIKFETTAGRVWFKVNGSGTAYEAALIAVLDELHPGLAPDVLGHDNARGWSLTRDAGPVLRSIAGPEALWQHWERLLPRYGQAQLDLTADRTRLASTGIPDRSPEQLPLEYRRLLGDLAAKPTDQGGLSRQQASALERLLPRYDDWCAELAARRSRTLCSTTTCTPTTSAGRVRRSIRPQPALSIGVTHAWDTPWERCSRL